MASSETARLRAAIVLAVLIPVVAGAALTAWLTSERAAHERAEDLASLRDLAALRAGRLEARIDGLASDLAWMARLASREVERGQAAAADAAGPPPDPRAPLWKEPLRERLLAFLDTHDDLHALRVLVPNGDELGFVGVHRGSDGPLLAYLSERRKLFSADFVEAASQAGNGEVGLSGVMIELSVVRDDEAGIPAVRAAVGFDAAGEAGVVIASIDLRPWVDETLELADSQRDGVLVTAEGYLLKAQIPTPDVAAAPAPETDFAGVEDEPASAGQGSPPAPDDGGARVEPSAAAPAADARAEADALARFLPGLVAQLSAPGSSGEAHVYGEDSVFLARKVVLPSAGPPRSLTLGLSRATSRLGPWPEMLPAWQLATGGSLVFLLALLPALRAASGFVAAGKDVVVGASARRGMRRHDGGDDSEIGGPIALEPAAFALLDLLGEIESAFAASDSEVAVRCDGEAPEAILGDRSWLGPLLLHLGRSAAEQSGDAGVNLCVSYLWSSDEEGHASDDEDQLCVQVRSSEGETFAGFDAEAGFETPMTRQLMSQMDARFERDEGRLLVGVSRVG